jgi:hypothetical protein
MKVTIRGGWRWVGAAMMVVLAALVAPRLYVRDLEDALVREANDVVAAPRPRRAHVDAPRPGSIADALRGVLPRYEASWNALMGDRSEGSNLLGGVARGERPLTELPPEVVTSLAALDPDLDAMLSASRCERADLGPDHDPWGPIAGVSWVGVLGAAKHAAIRMRLASGRGDGRVVSDCLDAMALGRDAAIAGGLIGRMIRAAVVGTLTPACGRAIAEAGAPEARDAAARLRRIRDAVPPFGATLREEMVQIQLLAFGRDLRDGGKARLLPRPRAFAEDASMAAGGRVGRWLSRFAWRDLRAFQGRLVDAGARPAPERDAAFAAVGRDPLLARLRFGEGVSDPGAAESYARYARRDAVAELRLDLLVAAAATVAHEREVGRWPANGEALASAGLLQPDEVRRLGRLVMAEARDGSLELKLALPPADGCATEAVVLHSAGTGAPE